MMTRDERQEINIQNWKKVQGRGTLVAVTGYGKTTVATKIIDRYILKNPLAKVLIVVPTKPLKSQWIEKLKKLNLNSYCRVEIINTVIKHEWDCNILIVDEAHRAAAPSFRQIFTKVSYNRLLCLTATLQRLDGLEKIIEYYAPVFDVVTNKECLENKWIAEYQEYKVLIDVDLTEYETINAKFLKYFSFFNYDFDLAMSCVKYPPKQNLLARYLNAPLKVVKANTYAFVTYMRARERWVTAHSKKIEIANKILDAKKDKKILTFSSSVEQAKSLNGGHVIHYKTPMKDREAIINYYANNPSGVIHSVDTLKEGLDVPGVSVAILVGYNSSILKKIQTIGRTIRKEGDKIAEIYTLVIKGTVEEQWFNKSSREGEYLTIDESDLYNLLGLNHEVQSDSLYIG